MNLFWQLKQNSSILNNANNNDELNGMIIAVMVYLSLFALQNSSACLDQCEILSFWLITKLFRLIHVNCDRTNILYIFEHIHICFKAPVLHLCCLIETLHLPLTDYISWIHKAAVRCIISYERRRESKTA